MHGLAVHEVGSIITWLLYHPTTYMMYGYSRFNFAQTIVSEEHFCPSVTDLWSRSFSKVIRIGH